jgi:hypothetical protein
MAECYGKCGKTRETGRPWPGPGPGGRPKLPATGFWCPECKKDFNAYLGPRSYRDYWTLDAFTFAREALKTRRLRDGYKALAASGDR